MSVTEPLTAATNFDRLIERYGSLLSTAEQSALQASLATPMPKGFWLNTHAADKEVILAELSALGVAYEPMPWHPLGFRCTNGVALGKTWLYGAGLLHIQEEVSMLPVQALAPEPGECVLDLCAAPGNKTAQIALMMQRRGTVVANDINYTRLRALGQVIKRMGLCNINLTRIDGTSYPKLPGQFDRVLVDAPCSCEGTLRKSAGRVVVPKAANSERLASTQIALLKKAMQLVKPGGRIVYSTCTFAPEENECVIDTLLKRFPEELVVRDVAIPHFNFTAGITEWQGRQLSPDCAKTWRVWPHLNNTGGFYIAVLEKRAKPTVTVPLRPANAVVPPVVQQDMPDVVRKTYAWFGIASAVAAEQVFDASGRRGIYMSYRDNAVHDGERFATLPFEAAGLFFIKTKIHFPKLSTAAVRLLGLHATRQWLNLSRAQLSVYLAKQTQLIELSDAIITEEVGYVVVKYRGIPLGLGVLRCQDNRTSGELTSLFPGDLLSTEKIC